MYVVFPDNLTNYNQCKSIVSMSQDIIRNAYMKYQPEAAAWVVWEGLKRAGNPGNWLCCPRLAQVGYRA